MGCQVATRLGAWAACMSIPLGYLVLSAVLYALAAGLYATSNDAGALVLAGAGSMALATAGHAKTRSGK